MGIGIKTKIMNRITVMITAICLLAFMSCTKEDDTEQKTFGIFQVQEDNTTVHMNGTIDRKTIQSFNQLKTAFPEAKQIVMLDCPGSNDDESNLRVAKEMHNLGYSFRLTPSSVIASGAVDMYVGGVKRTMESGAKIGVHSWGADPGEPKATSYPKGHEVHLQYIDYYTSVGFSQKQAEDFYYFTIHAAPAESIHWMTEAEVQQYNILKE